MVKFDVLEAVLIVCVRAQSLFDKEMCVYLGTV